MTVRIVSVHAMKSYGESGGMAPRILNHDIGWRWGKRPRYPLNRRLGASRSQSRRFGEEINLSFPPGFEPRVVPSKVKQAESGKWRRP